MSQLFKRTIENFVCEHCGAAVAGNGYTNHCSYCLWSKHVDNNPGDRSASCGGLMEPIEVRGSDRRQSIVHRCAACGVQKVNIVAVEDSVQALLDLVRLLAKTRAGLSSNSKK